jgi:PAS domain S-box-containing protein
MPVVVGKSLRETIVEASSLQWIPCERPRMSRTELTTFEDLLSTSPLSFALCDMNGTFLRVNQAFADLIGRRKSEVLGLSYFNIVPKEFEHQEAIKLRKLSEQGTFGPYEEAFLHNEGFLVPVSVSCWVVQSDGQRFILSIAQSPHARAEGTHLEHVGPVTRNRGDDREWSDAKNARRCELIDRKIQNTISIEESAELEHLQEALRAYLDRVAPLPMEGAKKLHAELVHRAKRRVTEDGAV